MDSRTILDMNGAEKTSGKRRYALLSTGISEAGTICRELLYQIKKWEKLVEFLTDNHQTDQVYDSKITDMMNASQSSTSGSGSGQDLDAYFVDAGKIYH